MAQSTASTVDEYLNELPEERRGAIAAVRKVIQDNLPPGYEEMMLFGMISYVVPLKTFPITYNKQPLQYAALASQKQYMSVYLMNVYGDPATLDWFTGAYKASGKRLDMGKSCVRFRKLDDLPLSLVGETIARTPVTTFIEHYESSRRR